MTEQENKTIWQNEPDSKELTEMAAEVSRSYAWKKAEEQSPAIDVDREWQRFCTDHPVRTAPHRGWHRWAIAASMLLLCTIGLALGWPYFREWKSPKASHIETDIPATDCANDSILEDGTKLTFRDTELHAILLELAGRHGAQVRYRNTEEVRLYVELEKSWSLQQCVDFLNHFERVNLKLTPDNVIVAE